MCIQGRTHLFLGACDSTSNNILYYIASINFGIVENAYLILSCPLYQGYDSALSCSSSHELSLNCITLFYVTVSMEGCITIKCPLML